MNIRIAVPLVLCLSALPVPAATPTIPVLKAKTVYLDSGALDTIQRENPAEYKRITEVISLAESMPCQSDEFPRILKARLDVQGKCGLQLMTSYPARRHFSFVLGDAFYEAVITMRDSGGTLVPAATK
jgi:hypothetical protein